MHHPRWLVALNLAFALLFLVSVGLQYNDPDPLRWMAIYGAGAITTVAALHVRGGWWAALAVTVAAAVWGAVLWSDVIGDVAFSDLWRKMSEKGGKVEVMREAGGLTIEAVWLAVATWRGRAARARG